MSLPAEVYGLVDTMTAGRISSLLHLADHGASAWMGGFAPGSAQTVENSQCKIFGTGAPAACLPPRGPNSNCAAVEVAAQQSTVDGVGCPQRSRIRRHSVLAEACGGASTEKGHLPEIPSEAEVKAKGVSVGEIQAKLPAKIEEMRERPKRLESRAAEQWGGGDENDARDREAFRASALVGGVVPGSRQTVGFSRLSCDLVVQGRALDEALEVVAEALSAIEADDVAGGAVLGLLRASRQGHGEREPAMPASEDQICHFVDKGHRVGSIHGAFRLY